MAALQATQPGDRWQARERWQSPVAVSSKAEHRGWLHPASLSFVSPKGCLVPKKKKKAMSSSLQMWMNTAHMQTPLRQSRHALPLHEPSSRGVSHFAKMFAVHQNTLVSVGHPSNPVTARRCETTKPKEMAPIWTSCDPQLTCIWKPIVRWSTRNINVDFLFLFNLLFSPKPGQSSQSLAFWRKYQMKPSWLSITACGVV